MKLAALEAIKQRAFLLRITQTELCKVAGVHTSTMRKRPEGFWKPTVTTLGKLERALDKLEKEKVS